MVQFDSQSKTLRGCYRLLKVKYHFFDTFIKGSGVLIIEVLH